MSYVVQFPKGEGPPIRNSRKSRFELVMPWVKWFAVSAPDEVSALIVIAGKGPVVASSFYIPKEADSDAVSIRSGCLGSVKTPTTPETAEYLAHIKSTGRALVNTIKMRKYHANVQKMGQFPPSHYYQKAVIASALPSDAVQGLCDAAARCPISNKGTAIILQPMRGQKLTGLMEDELPTAQVMSQAHCAPTAISTCDPPPLRKIDREIEMYRFISLQISIVDQPISRVRLVLFTDWIIIIAEFPKGPKNPKLRERCVQWVRETHAIVDPYAIKDPPEFGRSADWWTSTLGDIYGTNTPRLQQLKQKFDPGNFFQNNRNITPFNKVSLEDDSTFGNFA